MRTKLIIFFVTLTAVAFFSIMLNSCKEDTGIIDTPPSCEILTPVNGEFFELGTEVTFKIESEDINGNVAEINVYLDGSIIASISDSPYEYIWNTSNSEPGNYTIGLEAIDDNGNSSSIYEIILGLYIKVQHTFGSVTDYEGNIYKTIEIGDQIWMAENLRSTKYADGTDIIGAYAYNDDENNVPKYGRLYKWKTAMKNSLEEGTQGVCPCGWHLPTIGEWGILEMHLGMNEADVDILGKRGTYEGGKLKKVDTILWNSPNIGATNESGFSALPGGYQTSAFSYGDLGNRGYFWGSTPIGTGRAPYRRLDLDDSRIYYYEYYHMRDAGRSVRCIKDTLVE